MRAFVLLYFVLLHFVVYLGGLLSSKWRWREGYSGGGEVCSRGGGQETLGGVEQGKSVGIDWDALYDKRIYFQLTKVLEWTKPFDITYEQLCVSLLAKF